jgi:hypothetical protein
MFKKFKGTLIDKLKPWRTGGLTVGLGLDTSSFVGHSIFGLQALSLATLRSLPSGFVQRSETKVYGGRMCESKESLDSRT